MNMHVGCECNVVIATCPQRYLESTFLRCENVAFTTLPQPKHNVVTTLSQRDFVCWDGGHAPPAWPSLRQGIDEQPEGSGEHPHNACRMGVGGPMHSMKRWMYIFVWQTRSQTNTKDNKNNHYVGNPCSSL